MGTKKAPTTPAERARKRAKELTDLLWHAGTFLIINAFLWALDIVGGDGVNWAYWVTIGWGIGLAFHSLDYFIEGRGVTEAKTQEYLEYEQAHEPHHN